MHDVNVQEHAALQHLQRTAESGPDLDLVVRDLRRLSWVEEVPPNLLEPDLLQHAIEENFEEDKHVVVGFGDALDPGDFNSVLNFVDCGLHRWDLR